jgi:hypothetical protein
VRNLPGLRRASWASSAVLFERTLKIVSEGRDTLGLVINCNGMMTALQRKQESSLGVGDAALMLHSEPAALLQSQSRGICLGFSRASFEQSTRHIEDAATRRISRRSEVLQLLRGYLRTLERSRLGRTRNHQPAYHRSRDALTQPATRLGREQYDCSRRCAPGGHSRIYRSTF